MTLLHTPGGDVVIPCDGCTACCYADMVLLDPRQDNPKDYEIEVITRFAYPVAAIRHRPNGDCWYLERGMGCTIWHRRPSRCREFDCRVFLDLDSSRLVKQGFISRELVKAAQALDDRMKKRQCSTPDQRKIPGKAQCRRNTTQKKNRRTNKANKARSKK